MTKASSFDRIESDISQDAASNRQPVASTAPKVDPSLSTTSSSVKISRDSSVLPPLGELDQSFDKEDPSTMLPRLRSCRFIHAILLVGLVALSLVTKATVNEQPVFFFNSTLFPHIEQHLGRIQQSMTMMRTNTTTVGARLAEQGATPKYPIIMIPGFVTSGLELWEGHDCAAKKYFRQRLWGALGSMATSFFTDTECWRQHLALDPITGMDPPGIRLRTAQGFEAADHFMTAYWVWDKLIQNLAAVGYDGSTMSMEAYDWRLAFPLLEERDGYFTKLRHKIEAMHETSGKKVVIGAHSMGSPLVTYFFKWVTTSKAMGGGGGSESWVEDHIHALVNIAGPMLGVPKAVPSILSGEMRDTNVLMGTFGSMMEQFFGRRKRKELWSSWGSLWGMLPKGGDPIWGVGADLCPDGEVYSGVECISASCANDESSPIAPFISMDSGAAVQECDDNNSDTEAPRMDDPFHELISNYGNKSSWTTDETMDFLYQWGVGHGQEHSGAKQLHTTGNQDDRSPNSWADPTVTALPHAPSLHIYCLYGVGLDTERSFYYQHNRGETDNATQCSSIPSDLPFIMNGQVVDSEQNIAYGVKMVDGDASVPLLSLGYMCVDGWKKPFLNPSEVKVTTREYQHQQEFLVDDPMRGGPKSGDHVDILGNVDMTEDFLRIVTDFEQDKVDERIISNIEEIANTINEHTLGGLRDASTTEIYQRIRSTLGF